MIKNILIIATVLLVSCGSSKKVAGNNSSTKRYTVDKRTNSKSSGSTNTVYKQKPRAKRVDDNIPPNAQKVIWTAVTYKGVPYKYGGTNFKGMDCSGLVYTCFTERGIEIPRTSSAMYTKGRAISLREVRKGDLIFFHTSRKKNKYGVNHVGLVTSNVNGDVKFIHATSSKGVIVSSISESYWNGNYVGVKRVIE